MKKSLSIVVFLLMLAVMHACTLSETSENPDKNESDATESVECGAYEIGVAYTTPETGATHLGMEKFKELVEEETDGEVIVELYPNGQLYASEREAVEAAQAGNIEMTVAASAPVAGF